MSASSKRRIHTFEDFCEIVQDGQKADLIDGVIHTASPDNSDANEINVRGENWLIDEVQEKTPWCTLDRSGTYKRLKRRKQRSIGQGIARSLASRGLADQAPASRATLARSSPSRRNDARRFPGGI
jgi:hypothetical protein